MARGAYRKYEKKQTKRCLDCPAMITFGKRCPPCADIQSEKLKTARRKKRTAKERGERLAKSTIANGEDT